MDTNIVTVKLSQAEGLIMSILEAGEVPFLWGPPGIGKTELSRQVAMKLYGGKGDDATDYTDEEMEAFFRVVILSQREPVDLLGLPKESERKGWVSWLRPDTIPLDGVGLMLWDEWTQAGPALQAPARQMLTERRFGSHKLGDGWLQMAAGNYATDKAGSHQMLTHTKSAIIHLNLVTELEDWLTWALTKGDVIPDILGFLRFRPGLLHDFNKDAQTFPCPRTWFKMSQVFKKTIPPELELAAAAACIGIGPATEWVAFRRVYRALPDIDMILTHPDKAPVPKNDPAALYAVSAALARRCDSKTLANVVKYLKRIQQEYGVFCIRDAVRRDPTLTSTKTFTEWATANSSVLI